LRCRPRSTGDGNTVSTIAGTNCGAWPPLRFGSQRLIELRRQQLEAWRADQCRQLALFELKNDRRPEAERTAAGRYREPTFGLIWGDDP